jgi:hypothetical protein
MGREGAVRTPSNRKVTAGTRSRVIPFPPRRVAALLLAILFGATACSANPSRTPYESIAAPALPSVAAPSLAATPPAAATPDPAADYFRSLQGRWLAGPVPIADIKATMRYFNRVSAQETNSWVREIGSPNTLSLELDFTGDTFMLWWGTPQHPLAVGETGTFARTTVDGNSNFVLLTVPDGDGVDTYTLHFIVDHDNLDLHWIDSTEHGTTADKAAHRLFTIGFYCSAGFVRQP